MFDLIGFEILIVCKKNLNEVKKTVYILDFNCIEW